MSEVNTQKVVNTPAPPAGSLGRGELYAISIGQVIGVGVITLVGPMIAVTGNSVWLAYALAVIFGFISLLPYIFITSSLRFGAGIYSLIASTLDYRFSGLQAITFIPTTLGMASMGISFGMYAQSLIPGLSGTVAGIAIIALFVFVNWFGVNAMAKIQKYASWMLIAALLMFIIIGLFHIDYPEIFDVAADNFMANGSTGFFSAIATFMYSTVGYSLTMSYGAASKNAKRDIPWAMVMTGISLLVLYTGVAIVAAGAVPASEMAGQPLTVVAREVLPTPLFIAFIIGGPMIALVTTMNSSIAYYQMPFRQACQDGWLPKSWDIENKHGACIPMLAIVLVSGIVPQLTGFSIVSITNNLQLMTSLLAFVGFAAFYAFPKKYPEAWRKSRLYIGNGPYYVLTTIALLMQVFIFVNAARNLTVRVVIISLVALGICMLYGFLRAKSPNVQIKSSTWED